MIIILSSEADISTNNVIDWLRYYNVDFIRVNDTSKVRFCITDVSIESFAFDMYVYENEEVKYSVSSSDVSGFWYRRGEFNLKSSKLEVEDDSIRSNISLFLKLEARAILGMCYYFFESYIKKSIGSIFHNETNKLINMNIASKVGLKIPKSTVLDSKEELINFYNKEAQKVITKSASQANSIRVPSKKINIFANTSKVGVNDLLEGSGYFFPTLFQKNIQKKFELRIFFINSKIFTSAILSQENEQTKIDFRVSGVFNRTVPFELPCDIKDKILGFINEIKMKSGSIDMIVSVDGDYYFLEVNPVGQFDYYGYPCNYNLSREVAKCLI